MWFMIVIQLSHFQSLSKLFFSSDTLSEVFLIIKWMCLNGNRYAFKKFQTN